MNNKANITSFVKGHKLVGNGIKSYWEKGGKAWNKGKKLSKDHVENMSKSHLGKMTGENNPRWSGGNKLARLEKIAGRKKPELCEICGAMGRICFDHNHETGKFRGWICHRCNVVLGFVKDNSELLKSLSDYLAQEA